MQKLKLGAGLAVIALLAACVTINVYFPEAAARKAADEFIGKVWGEDATQPPPGVSKPQSTLDPLEQGWEGPARALAGLLDLMVPAAHAQSANLDIRSPAIAAIQSAMATRHESLRPFYDAGAIGLTDDGRIAVRDASLVGLKDRNRLNQLVAQDSADRDALYAEVARANGHPEWEAQIRRTWADRWVAQAPSGWWYRTGGGWRQK